MSDLRWDPVRNQIWENGYEAGQAAARADPDLTTAYMVGFEKGKTKGRADLVARLRAAVEALPDQYGISADGRGIVSVSQVLAAIEKEEHHGH